MKQAAGIMSAWPSVWWRYAPAAKPPVRIDRFAFYERAKTAYAVVMTGETAKYGNLLLKKGVTPPNESFTTLSE